MVSLSPSCGESVDTDLLTVITPEPPENKSSRDSSTEPPSPSLDSKTDPPSADPPSPHLMSLMSMVELDKESEGDWGVFPTCPPGTKWLELKLPLEEELPSWMEEELPSWMEEELPS